MTYKDCPYYNDDYCLKDTDGFGMNHTCLKRCDCPEVVNLYYRQRAKELLERPLQEGKRNKRNKRNKGK